MRHVHFGDSNSTYLALNSRLKWPWLLAADQGIAIRNLVCNAISGSCAIDQADAAFNWTVNPADRHFVAVGTNDQQNYGVDAAKLAASQACYRALLASLTQTKSICGAAGWTLSSGWASNAPYTPGMASSTAGATATHAFTGDLYLWTYTQPNAPSVGLNVSIDGGAPAFVSTSPVAYLPRLPRLVGVNGLSLYHVPCSAGAHTMTATVNAGPVYLCAIGTGPVSWTGSGGVWGMDITYNGTTTPTSDANVNAYNAMIASACAELGATFIGGGNLVQIDSLCGGVHFDDDGHWVRYLSAKAAL